ncbi:MAG: sulfurtransferase [Frankiales bacterium]|nr:sulfurtransferase [Frankiales bacterium]
MTVTALRALPEPRTVDDLLWEARRQLDRLSPQQTLAAQRLGALLVDIRPHAQRVLEGEIPGALVVERNVLEWRLDPQSTARVPESSYDAWVVVLCSEGYTSSLAAASLQVLGISRATDLEGGFVAWREAGLPTVPGGTAAGERSGAPALLHVDEPLWEVRVSGERVHVTRQEFKVLAALHASSGRVLTRSTLAQMLDVYPATTRALDVHVCRLRRKLGDAAHLLVTVRGVGWRLLAPEGPTGGGRRD